MKPNKPILYAAGAFLTLAFAGMIASPKVSAAIRATFVEVVVPSNPFYDALDLTPQDYVKATGPDTGTLALTNITVTNFDSTRNLVYVFAPLFASGGCRSAVTGGSYPALYIYVDPNSTKTVSYPTPLTFTGIFGHTCVAAQTSGHVQVYVNGFVN